MLEVTLDDYATLLSPKTIVFCEGTSRERKRRDFDARCYSNIFGKTHPEIFFYSLGSCNDIEKDKISIIEFVKRLTSETKIIRLVDRDDRSDEEIEDLKNNGIKVLGKRNIEGYLLDETVLIKWCESANQPDKVEQVKKVIEEKIAASVMRGNAPDDLKSAGNEICTELKKILQITQCGNNGESIMRDTISRLITEDMKIYQQLYKDIFE